MKRSNKIALLLAAMSAVWAARTPARAQQSTAPVIKSKPVHTQETKPTTTSYEVLHMMSTAIQVRSLVNEREIHTFIYSDQIRDQMKKMLDQGGYQYGDKIKIRYMPGSDVALRIKGKPSKAI